MTLSTAVKSPKRLVMFSKTMYGFASGSFQGANFLRTGPIGCRPVLAGATAESAMLPLSSSKAGPLVRTGPVFRPQLPDFTLVHNRVTIRFSFGP